MMAVPEPEFPLTKEHQVRRRKDKVCPTSGLAKRSCTCRQCLGARSRRKGQKKQRMAAKAMGIKPSRFASQMGHEENLRGVVRIEVKAGAQVGPIATRFLAAEAQSNAAKAQGDPRPFVMVAMPDGMTDGLAIVRTSDWPAVISAYVEELWTP